MKKYLFAALAVAALSFTALLPAPALAQAAGNPDAVDLPPFYAETFFNFPEDAASAKKGGKRLLLFVMVLAPFLVLQNLTGLLLAWSLDLHPLMGLIGGTITLVGGHGTGAAYAERFAEVHNIQAIMELAMTGATLGLVLGGLCGGPLAQWLIRRHRLAVPVAHLLHAVARRGALCRQLCLQRAPRVAGAG